MRSPLADAAVPPLPPSCVCSRVVEETLELFTCSRTSHTSQVHGGGGPGDADGPGGKGNITIPSSYNELATLMSVTGEGREWERWTGPGWRDCLCQGGCSGSCPARIKSSHRPTAMRGYKSEMWGSMLPRSERFVPTLCSTNTSNSA